MNNNDDETLNYLLAGCVVVFLLPVATMFSTVRDFLLQHHILVPADQALIAIHDWGVGIDLPRLLILILAIALLMVIAGATLRARRARQTRERR